MTQSNSGGGNASSNLYLPPYDGEVVRHILLGDRTSLSQTITRMAVLGYCEMLEWGSPVATGRYDEHVRIMTRRRTIP
jgi:hypothetical protein